MKLIKKIKIGTANLSASAQSRLLSVSGDDGATFNLQVKRSNGDYYNFDTTAFTSSTTTKTTLTNVELAGGYSTSILFPASSGDTYTIYIYALSHFETEFDTVVSKNKLFYSTTITQLANSTITFQTATSVTGVWGSAATFGTSTGSPTTRFVGGVRDLVRVSSEVDTDTDVSNAGVRYVSDSNFLTTSNTQPYDEDFYWETTETVDGSNGGATTVVVDDTTSLVIGMELVYKTGTTAPASATYITAVNVATKTLTFSRSTTLVNNNTMTFRAYGAKYIKDAIGIGLEFKNFKSNLVQTTTPVRTDASPGTTINVNGTRGISKGAYTRGVASDNYYDGATVMSITSVSQHLTQGTISQAQNFAQAEQGEKIYIAGSSHTVKVEGDIYIDRYPIANQTIYMDLDKVWVTGTSS